MDSLTIVEPSVGTLMEQFQAVVFEKDEFEYREKSILITSFAILALQHSQSNVGGKNQKSLNSKSPLRVKRNRIEALIEKTG